MAHGSKRRAVGFALLHKEAYVYLMLSMIDITQRVTRYSYSLLPGENLMRQAAVAAILRAGPAGPELLLIRRAENPRDHWSGHMAFPGGRVEARDPDSFAAAQRETLEEIGLSLSSHAASLGRLSTVLAKAHGKPLPMVITPFVFHLPKTPSLALNHEVQEVVWIPLSYFVEPKHRDSMEWPVTGISLRLPCYRFEGRLIWGLTLKMIDELLTLLT
jgi:8-oxo-dGTP pyrophosphatase MutT (NUDIX family)